MTQSPKIIRPPNRIREKLGLAEGETGFSINPEAIQRAEKYVHEAGFDYVAIAIDDWEELHNLIDHAITQQPSVESSTIANINRIAHDMKGQAGAFGYDYLTEIAEYLEHFTRPLKHPNPKQLAIIKAHIDAIHMVIAQKIMTDDHPLTHELKQSLRLAIEKYS